MRLLLLSLLLLFHINAFCQPPAYVPTAGLVGFWPFSGNANDVSGNNNNGVVTGASLTTDRFSAANSAYVFNGVNNYITVTSNTTLSGFNNLSISAWINPAAFGGIQGIVTKWYQVLNCNNNANSDTYEAAISSNQLQFATNNNNLTGFTSPPSLPSSSINSWVHVVYLSDISQGQFIYINGVLSGSFATSGAICSSTNPLYFGTDYHGTLNTFHRFFNGKIDDIGIWNRLLTNCEIQQLYNSSLGSLVTVGSNTAVCLGSQAALQASGASTYTWLPSGTTGSLILVSPTVTTNYTVVGTNSLGCTLSNTLTLVVNPNPTVVITPSPATFCAGEQVTLTATGANSYSWTGIGTGSSVVVTAISPTSSYTLVGITGPCAVTSFIFYSVPAAPLVTVQSSSATVCQGASVTLSANGASTYTWQPGNLTGVSIVVSPSSNTTYTVVGTAASGGCFDSDTVSIAVTVPNPIFASANPTSVCPGNASTLTASGAVSYTWFPGNLIGSSVLVTPASTTQYTASSDQGGCIVNSVVNVSVGLDVSVTAVGDLCTNSSMNLVVSPALAGYSYVWAGPGILGSNTGSSIALSQAGIYSVVVTNTLNNCTGSAGISIGSGLNSIALSIVPSSSVTCFPGPPVNFLVSVSANLSWLPATEVSPNTGPLVSVSPSVTTSYTVNASLGACTGSAAVTISVNVMPTVTAVSSGTSMCAGKTISLSAVGAEDYNWSPGNLSGSSVTVSPGFNTTYTLTGSNGNCSSLVNLPPIEVFPTPLVTTTVSPATICQGKSSTLTAAGAPLLAWLLGDLPPLSINTVVSPSSTTIYSVVGTNSLGCSSIATVQVNVIESPQINAVTSNSVVCAGQNVTLTANGGITYTWIPGFQVSPSLVVTPQNSEIYTVVSGNTVCSRATVTVYVNYCINNSLGVTNAAEVPKQDGSDTYKINFTVTANNAGNSELSNLILENDLERTFPYPISYTVVNLPTVISKNSSLTVNTLFNGSSEKGITLPANSKLKALKRDTLVFTVLVQPKNFSGELRNSVVAYGTDLSGIVASDSSNNGFLFDPDNDGNPTNNNTMTPIEIRFVELFIPNGFSPDGDGTNDLFVIKGLNGASVDLSVYNRWGNKVYAKSNYDNSWDGTLNAGGVNWGNGRVPEGTYYYTLSFNTGKKEMKTGFIVVRYE